VLMKCMRETSSHAEREILMNSAVSGAFRLVGILERQLSFKTALTND
jgi:hypothetical protein